MKPISITKIMKTKITILFFIAFTSILFAQDADKQYDLLQSKTKTNILYDRVYMLSDATNLKSKIITADIFKQVYHEIQRTDFLQRLPKYDFIKEQANLGFAQNQVPISILIADFENIKKQAIDNKTVFLNKNNQFETEASNIFETHNLTLIAPILSKHKGTTVDFVLKNNLIFNTTNQKIASISVNFNNGNGFEVLKGNESITVDFSTVGKKTIDFKITLSNGKIINQTSTIDILESEYPANYNRVASPNIIVPNVVTPITATIGFRGPTQDPAETASFFGQGQYKLFPDTVNQILDKPIILLDGFDPGDTRNCDIIYNLLNYGTGQNLATDLRAQGYDVIILNFPTYTRTGTTTVVNGGVDYVERNAMILVELLNQINLSKVGTAKNVVIGPSMGGLISRYGLRYMEQNSLNHDTRLYISFDSPHYGANVPVSLQHLLNYMAYGPLGSTAVQPIVDGMLKSPAAREMLIDHMEGHLIAGDPTEWQTAAASLLPTGAPNYRNAFQTRLNTMGFPTLTRNVSIANGAGNGTMTGTPGMTLMDHTFNTSSTQRAIIKLNFTPTTNTTLEVSRFRGQQWFLFWITGYESRASSKSPTYTAGLDSAPGGRFDMSALTAGTTDPLLIEFANSLLINYFDFIPTWSAMSVTGTQNVYANFPAIGSVSPFAAWSIPTINENHITLNTQNIAFAINEIVGTLSTEEVVFKDLYIQNPIENAIEIYAPKAINDATITINDLSGKTILTKSKENIEGNYQLPVVISNGVYLLNIKNIEGSKTVKLVK